VFSPPLEGCDLGGMTGDDPAQDDLPRVLDWIDQAAQEGSFAGALDTERVGLSGHSAGGASTATAGEADPRWKALLTMGPTAAAERDVPMMIMGGTCDAYDSQEEMAAAYDVLADGHLVQVHGAGHLAFSDLCDLELDELADDLLLPREDVNQTLAEMLRGLASDGCPGGEPAAELADCAEAGYLPLEASDPIVRHYTTVFFDEALKGQGPGVAAGVYAEAEVW